MTKRDAKMAKTTILHQPPAWSDFWCRIPPSSIPCEQSPVVTPNLLESILFEQGWRQTGSGRAQGEEDDGCNGHQAVAQAGAGQPHDADAEQECKKKKEKSSKELFQSSLTCINSAIIIVINIMIQGESAIVQF
jgi:hypothetical protein